MLTSPGPISSSGAARGLATAGTVAASVLLAPAASAQEMGIVEGTVVSTVGSEAGEPVPGITVWFPEIPLQGATDREGRFEFPIVPAGRLELRADFLGCTLASRDVVVRADRTTTVDLRVTRPALELAGIVAAGVAAERPDTERPYAAGRLDLDDREGHPGRSIADLLRGHFPGVEVLQGSGQPGSEVRIQFRGPASISGDRAPLLVVDGIITSGGFVDLNPEDVETVQVLKGSAATAEYGARGEAGVIEITTESGLPEPAPEEGPLVVVDGEVSAGGLREVAPAEIVRTELLTGARAAVLFGSGAAERGVVRITTRAGARGGDPGILSRCAPPPR